MILAGVPLVPPTRDPMPFLAPAFILAFIALVAICHNFGLLAAVLVAALADRVMVDVLAERQIRRDRPRQPRQSPLPPR